VGGKLLFFGVFDVLESESFPLHFPSVLVVNRWCGGLGEHQERVRWVADSGDVVPVGRGLVFSTERESDGCVVATEFANLSLPEPGVYWVEVFLDGSLHRRTPVVVEAI